MLIFLSCLGQGSDYFYVLNAGAFAYMEQQKLPHSLLARLELEFSGEVICSLPLADSADKVVRIETALDWQKWLDQQDIKTKQHRRRFNGWSVSPGYSRHYEHCQR